MRHGGGYKSFILSTFNSKNKEISNENIKYPRYVYKVIEFPSIINVYHVYKSSYRCQRNRRYPRCHSGTFYIPD